ncbi:MAG TPA: hypothetical protein VMO26_30080 [Vicinamibacterales bacterium]|nr:hypothetical protein [Vicinamibacterales bacterium]
MTLPHDEPTIQADDPIVEDVRAQRDSIAAALNYDLEALFERLKQVEESERKAGRVVLPAAGKPGAAA